MATTPFKSITTSWNNLSDRDRKILLIGIIVASFIILVKYAFMPFLNWREELKKDLQYNELIMEKMMKTISSQAKIEEELNRLKSTQERLRRRLIDAKDPDLAAAELIKNLRNLASTAGIDTSRISTNKSKEKDGYFMDVPLSIPSMRCDTKQLYDFLANIKKSQQLMLIKELRVRITNMKDPTEISVNMEISGYMFRPPESYQNEKKGT